MGTAKLTWPECYWLYRPTETVTHPSIATRPGVEPTTSQSQVRRFVALSDETKLKSCELIKLPNCQFVRLVYTPAKTTKPAFRFGSLLSLGTQVYLIFQYTYKQYTPVNGHGPIFSRPLIVINVLAANQEPKIIANSYCSRPLLTSFPFLLITLLFLPHRVLSLFSPPCPFLALIEVDPSYTVIPRLHDEAGSTSWLVQLTWSWLDDLARCLLDVWLMIAWSCKRGIRAVIFNRGSAEPKGSARASSKGSAAAQ